VEVAIKGVGEAQATAGSKQDAETQAAAEFMRKYG
jgi:ribonuclease-3